MKRFDNVEEDENNDLDRIVTIRSRSDQQTQREQQEPEVKKEESNLAMQIIKSTFDFGILRENSSFTLICMANFFLFAGYMAVFVFIPIRGNEVIGNIYSLVLSIIGK